MRSPTASWPSSRRPRLAAHAPQRYGGGVLAVFGSNVLNLAGRDPADQDGVADGVGWRFSTLGPLGIAAHCLLLGSPIIRLWWQLVNGSINKEKNGRMRKWSRWCRNLASFPFLDRLLNIISPSIIPENETQRMAAVRRYDILDTPPDGAFDRITAIAARRFQVPIAIISIVDYDRIWFKSRHGLDATQIDRAPGLCASAILAETPHVLSNAMVDPRSLANPLVASDFGLRFYAGIPLRTHDGFNLGTLCVIDREPRPVDQRQIDDLSDLASIVMDQMELRISARDAIARAQLMAKEIDHRVTNSLQFISGLLAMQGRSSNPETANHLKMAANRVAAVAQVHRNFYTNEAADTSCITFLRRLCADLSGILATSIEVDGDEGRVPTTRIQPIGLMVNELVNNAAKHGAGRINVSYAISSARHKLTVCDEGKGLPDRFDPDQTTGLGMKVVSALAKQLGGRITAKGNPAGRGSCFEVVYEI